MRLVIDKKGLYDNRLFKSGILSAALPFSQSSMKKVVVHVNNCSEARILHSEENAMEGSVIVYGKPCQTR